MNNEAYNIIISFPKNLEIEKFSVDMGIGSIDLHEIMASNTKLVGSTKINMAGFCCDSLELNSILANISAANISVQKERCLRLYGSGVIVSSDIKGDVLIETAGISNTDITFFNSDRVDFSLRSTWETEPENREEGTLINGEKYNLECTDSNLDAPFKIEAVSSELMPIENIKIKFVKQL